MEYLNTKVIIDNRTHLVDYDKIIKEFIGEKEYYLDENQQKSFKNIFIELKVNLKHSATERVFNKIKKSWKKMIVNIG